MGVAEGCTLRRDVPKDEVLTYADVELPAGRLVDRLRAEQAAELPVRAGGRRTMMPARRSLYADLEAMAEGEPSSSGPVAARVLVHARWRAVLVSRMAQQLFAGAWTRPLALWLADRVLAFSGAEIQPKSHDRSGLVLKHTTGLVGRRRRGRW